MRSRRKFTLCGVPFYAPFLEPCDCPEGKAAYERETAEKEAQIAAEEREERERKHNELVSEIMRESGLGARFANRTFDTFIADQDNMDAYEAAVEYVEDFKKMLPAPGTAPDITRNGLFIMGNPGTGKTHLAAAIANKLIGGEHRVIMATMIDLLGSVRNSFSYEDGGAQVLNRYKKVPLLIIDDLGKEPPTEWAVSTIYNIINGRYEAYLPTIVTANYSDKDLINRLVPRDTKDTLTARALVDRLYEMCTGVNISGESRRGRQ